MERTLEIERQPDGVSGVSKITS